MMPVASSIAQHKDNPDYADGAWALVMVEIN